MTENDKADAQILYDLTGVTLDLGGYTYTQKNFAHVFLGTSGVIKNGKMVCDNGSYALFIGDEGETTAFTVDGVEMVGGINIYNASGVVLKNLTVNGTNYYAVWMDEGASATIESGTYTAGDVAVLGSGDKSELHVTGGTFCANEQKLVSANGNGVVAVSGGSFTKAVLPEYCAAGFVPAVNADGTYGVKVAPVAKIGTVEYATLADAIAAAKDGDTVTLTADINTPETSYYIQKSLTIDLGGKTLTGSGYDGVFNIEGENAAVHIKNGKIVAVEQTGTAGKYTMAVWACAAGCEVTLEDLDVSQQITHTDDKQMDMIYTSKGTIIINSGRFESGTPAWTLNCNDSAYKAGTAKIIVNGGTFVGYDPRNNTAEGEGTSFVAPGVGVDAADGSFTAKAGMTAQVMDAKGASVKAFATLADAITAAARKSTVTLLADTKENVTISTPYVTLDLNGHTLNGSTGERKPALTITARTVTIKDSSEAQTGTIMREDTAENSGVSSHYVIDIQGNAWVMFESGKVKNNSGNTEGKGAPLVRVGDDSVAKYPGLTIKGGTFTQDNFIVIKVNRGDLFLNGGTLNSVNNYAVENWHRTTIKGGTVNGPVAAWTYSDGPNSTLTISSGTVNGNVLSVNYGSAENKLAKVEITGGTVNGALGTYTYSNGLTATEDATKATIGITGGTFANDPTKYVVEGATVTKNSEGKFGVEKAYLAKVGNTSYYTMDEAFKAQTTSGEAVVLLRDYTTGGIFKSGSINRTVDLNEHTWTYTGTDVNDAAFEINHSDVTLTVKNGTVVSSSMVGLIPSAMGGTIKYDNSGLVLDGVTATANGNSGIETNGNNTNDTVTLKNSTLNVPNGFGIYFPSSGTLTLDNSTVNAKTMGVQVCAGSLSINGGSAVTVTGDAVPKAENDGAIQDGAAISVVNRTGYKGLGTVTVSGGKFTAKEGNSAIKAYDWANANESEFTANDKVAVSGGAFSSKVPESCCAENYKPVKNADGTYTVKVANVTITVTSIPDKIATLIGGGKYVTGEEVTLVAPEVSGYSFDGWYSGNNRISKDMTYVVTAGEADSVTKYVAIYKGTGTKKLSVNLGKGEAAYTCDGVSGTWYDDITNNEFANGAKFTVTAKPFAGYTFLYWINDEGKIVSDTVDYEFYLVNDMQLTACYRRTTSSDNLCYVIFRDIDNRVLWSGNIVSGAKVSVPAHKNYTGYKFVGWAVDPNGEVKYTLESGTITINEATTFYAKYEVTGDFSLTVNGDIDANTYKYGQLVTVKAEPKNGDKFFSGWYIGDTLVSYDLEYMFYITDDTSLTAKYEGDAEVVKKPILNATMSGKTYDETRPMVTITVTWAVPEGYTIMQGGLIRAYSKTAMSKDDITLEKVNDDSIVRNTSTRTDENNTYAYTLKWAANSQYDVYAVGYIIYRNNTTGELITQYTDVVNSSNK